VLTRKANESIVIGSVIQIQVLKIENGKVKLGFSAPPDVLIRRTEIPERMQSSDGVTSCLSDKKGCP
jgi:carbon storage regulator